MKIFDIALKDLLRSTRSAISLVFMFGIPLMVTGLFYLMFGRISSQGNLDLPRTRVAIANLDQNGPRLEVSSGDVPGGFHSRTISGLVVEVLQSADLADLIDPFLVPDQASAIQAVDSRQAQVAIIIPDGFSHHFAELYESATIEIYQDPTLTIGPEIIQSVLNQFMDSLSAVKIAVKVTIELEQNKGYAILGQVIEQYLDAPASGSDDLAANYLDVRTPGKTPSEGNPIVRLLGPVMGGMMVFYAFYTGVSTGESILREEEERTLPRLFTTPTPQATILAGKFLSIFITVCIQIIVLLIAGHYIFGIRWGPVNSLAWVAAGTILSASTFGVFLNSFLKNTKQGGVIFGGVLTFSGMLGMVRVFGINSASASRIGDTVSLIVPQGWAVRGLVYVLDGHPLLDAQMTFLALAVWSAVFFTVGVWRFNKRYA